MLFATHPDMLQCSNCGASLAPDARFCPRCGNSVAAAPAAQPPAPPDRTDIPAAPAVPPVTPVAATPPAAATPPPPVTRTVPPATHAVPPATHAVPPATPVTAAAKQPRSTWWIIPLVIVGLVLIAWLLLAGLPFGRDEGRTVAAGPETETIAEGTAPPPQPQQTGTIVDVDTSTEPPPELTDSGVTTTQAPPLGTQPPPTATQPPPVIVDERPTPTPRPNPTPPARTPVPPARNPDPPVRDPAPPVRDPAPPARDPAPATPVPAPARTGEISESEATSVLRGFITSQSYYEGVRPECVQIRGSGYRNVGYGFSVWDSCPSGGGSRMLGRWRVDSKTREVFRQAGDGRYLRP